MEKELNFKEGVEYVKELISKCKNNPVLIATYGFPQNGKSTFIDFLEDKLRGYYYFYGFGGSIYESQFKDIIKEEKYLPEISGMPTKIYMFHCDWHKGHRWYGSESDDPSNISRKVLGREMDINLCVYNPTIETPTCSTNFIKSSEDIRGKYQYDLILRNNFDHKKFIEDRKKSM